MKIEGFRNEMDETRRRVMLNRPNLTLQEATTLAAKYELVAPLAEKGGTMPLDIIEEISRRLSLIEGSDAYRTAKSKLTRHLEER